ncbi:MAG: hypothetical protein ACRCTP_17910 [Aeromonas popoffii]|uniref:hypothetical protein n=1 Tax=Aeromonas popoffii TaxID=70856 RepID=UPI003F367C09
MKVFMLEVAKIVFSCFWLLVLATSLNWSISMDRITEYKALSAKMDAMAEYLAVEYADVLAMPADVE